MVVTFTRDGVIGTGLAGHALALTLVPSATKAGTLRSARVVRRGPRHSYGPLGFPLRRARFRHWLIRAALPRRRLRRRASRVPLRAHVLRPLPRRAPARVRLRTGVRGTSSSPRQDRLDARVVHLTRLQASLDVAARVLAPSEEALDTPLGPRDSRHAPGVCYSALRRLPRRDLHPLETNGVKLTLDCLLRHDAPRRLSYRTASAPAAPTAVVFSPRAARIIVVAITAATAPADLRRIRPRVGAGDLGTAPHAT